MKKTLVLILFLNYFFSCYGQTPDIDPHWQLLWEDNFNFLNSDIWNVYDHYDHYGEVTLFRKENVYTEEGILKLHLKRLNEDYECPNAFLTCDHCSRQKLTGKKYQYSSGSIGTQIPYNMQYGYIEARIKIPDINGVWSAFWTFAGNPYYQEIDISETVPGQLGSSLVLSAPDYLHTKYINTTSIHSAFFLGDTEVHHFTSCYYIQDYTQWHIFGLEWSPSRIIWYVDNIPVRLFEHNYVNAPATIIFGLGLRPDSIDFISCENSSNPHSVGNMALVNDVELPLDMSIDYVKVYELNKNCNEFINAPTYNFSLYDNYEKEYINIGDFGGQNFLSINDNFTLRASQYVKISGEFSVPQGASLFTDADLMCSPNISGCEKTLNICDYNFYNYDNSIKKAIELGGIGCNLNIQSPIKNILLYSISKTTLKPGVTITPINSHMVEFKIVSCN